MFSFSTFFHDVFFAAVTILAILNPFGNLAQFLAMAEGIDPVIKQKLFRNILYTAFIIVLIFLFFGPFVMHYVFRISIVDMRLAGGLILIVMGIKNLFFPIKQHVSSDGADLTERELIHKSIIPMAFPMLMGPGTLATVIVVANDIGKIKTFSAVVIAFILLFILFHFAASIEKIFGKLILYVTARVIQVFIVSMGIKMLVNGITGIIR